MSSQIAICIRKCLAADLLVAWHFAVTQSAEEAQQEQIREVQQRCVRRRTLLLVYESFFFKIITRDLF